MATTQDSNDRKINLFHKLTGIIFVLAGVLGIALGSVDTKQGFFVSDLGLWSALFTFMTGVGGLLSYIDASATMFPYTACCVALFVTEIATAWTGAIAVRKTKAWCVITRTMNITTDTGPIGISQTCGSTRENTVVFIEYVIIAVACFVMVIAMATIAKQGYNTWQTLVNKVSGDTNQTGSRGETIRRSPGSKAASDFQVSAISHSDDLSSQSMSSLPQVESNPRFIEDESYMRGTTSVRRDFKPGTLRDDKTNTINENMNVLMNENNY